MKNQTDDIADFLSDASLANFMYFSETPMAETIDRMIKGVEQAHQSGDSVEVEKHRKNIRTLMLQRQIVL